MISSRVLLTQFWQYVNEKIYPEELQLNKANTSDTEASFWDLLLFISNDIVYTKFYDKPGDFDFETANFPFLDGDVPCSTSYGVYIFRLIRFAWASSHVDDFDTRNQLKLFKLGYRYHKLRKTFSKFYSQYYNLIFKFNLYFNLSCARDFWNQTFMAT